LGDCEEDVDIDNVVEKPALFPKDVDDHMEDIMQEYRTLRSVISLCRVSLVLLSEVTYFCQKATTDFYDIDLLSLHCPLISQACIPRPRLMTADDLFKIVAAFLVRKIYSLSRQLVFSSKITSNTGTFSI